MHNNNTFNNLDLSECGSDIFLENTNFRTENFYCQLAGSLQHELSISAGKTEVFFNDGVSRIDIVIALEESNENSR